MKKPKAKVHLYLTENQMKILRPLFDEAQVAFDNNEHGMVVLQAWHSGIVDAGFVPHLQTKQIRKILEEI